MLAQDRDRERERERERPIECVFALLQLLGVSTRRNLIFGRCLLRAAGPIQRGTIQRHMYVKDILKYS